MINTFVSTIFSDAPMLHLLLLQEAIPAGGWQGVLDSTQDPALCPQLQPDAFLNGKVLVQGEEDCLYMNVFTPDVSNIALQLEVSVCIPNPSRWAYALLCHVYFNFLSLPWKTNKHSFQVWPIHRIKRDDQKFLFRRS